MLFPRTLLLLALFFGVALPVQAALEVECPGSVGEGEPFVVRVHSDTPLESVTIRFLGKELRPVVSEGEGRAQAWALLGIGMHERRSGSEFPLVIEAQTPTESLVEKRTIRRTDKKYEEQWLDVADKFLNLKGYELKRHHLEQEAVKQALARISPSRAYTLPLTKPVDGRTSSTYGLRRFFNKIPKRPHSGWDIAATEGTPAVACADGLVTLAGDHFFAGNSVYIDHGQGLVSMYFHLSKIEVAEGQAVRRGETVGLIGATGRVTGPHLHWGISVLGELVDPNLLVGN